MNNGYDDMTKTGCKMAAKAAERFVGKFGTAYPDDAKHFQGVADKYRSAGNGDAVLSEAELSDVLWCAINEAMNADDLETARLLGARLRALTI